MSTIHPKTNDPAALLSIFVFCAVAVGPAGAAMLGTTYTGYVYSINETNGTGTLLGYSGYSLVNSLACDSGGTVYAANNSFLLTIDPLTGKGTQAAPLVTPNWVRALDFSADGVLYGIVDMGALYSHGPDNLCTIDTATGTITQAGPTGCVGMTGLAFSSGGTLYGWDIGTGTGNGAGLVTIDPLTGNAADVNPAVGGPNVQSLDFGEGPGAPLYAMVNNSLYTVDTATGTITLVGSGIYRDVRGIAVLTEPKALVAAVEYEGDVLVSTEGASAVDVYLSAVLLDADGNVAAADGEKVTLMLTADGTVMTVVTAFSAGGVASASLALGPGVYTIAVTVNGSAVTASADLIVYDPFGGFVTGGGWLSGGDRCNFGFNAKYWKGVPAGEFECRSRSLHLKSTSIQHLVITDGSTAQLGGWAFVNGEAGGWFTVKAVDNGEPGVGIDAIELKVWQPGAEPGSAPIMLTGGLLRGGNISVHAR